MSFIVATPARALNINRFSADRGVDVVRCALAVRDAAAGRRRIHVA